MNHFYLTKAKSKKIAKFLYSHNEKLLNVCIVGAIITDGLNRITKNDLTIKLIIGLILSLLVNRFVKKFFYPYRKSLKTMGSYFLIQLTIIFYAIKKHYAKR